MLKNDIFNDEETIAAISTPIGEGGLGIIRISGGMALSIAQKIFEDKHGQSRNFPAEDTSHRVFYGYIKNPKNKRKIDEVLLTIMKAPFTYTRENVVEISCHGGIKLIREILEVCLENGARLAQPGEFTYRAFTNGRIDLLQAEAVIDLIKSKTERAIEVSVDNLQGLLSKKIGKIRDELVDILSLIEAHIDFEEYIDTRDNTEIEKDIKRIKEYLEVILNSYKEGRILTEGLKVVIIGCPNVGKSSLLNALIGMNKVIVTDIPGTTRDIIEEFVCWDGISVRLLDTAGVRESQDIIEKIGIEKTKEKIKEADIILMMIDGSKDLGTEDGQLLSFVKESELLIMISNKIDLGYKEENKKRVEDILHKEVSEIKMSIVQEKGLIELKELIKKEIYNGVLTVENEGMITNFRQRNLIEKGIFFLDNALKGHIDGQGDEFVSLELREALDHLGMITGEVTNEEILENIFSRFCVGK
ncbi:MAG: tRNA uridine-5-carboxymethylaminomethyl(34) synthesis GTPase MnmE [bacterium]